MATTNVNGFPLRNLSYQLFIGSLVLVPAACVSGEDPEGDGAAAGQAGQASTGGTTNVAGATSSGGSQAGGRAGNGGATATGGISGAGRGGTAAAGTTSTGGSSGGPAGGGSGGQAGLGSGGSGPTGGKGNSGGRAGMGQGGTSMAGSSGMTAGGTGGTAGTAGTGTAGSAGSPPVELDCDTPMPTGGTEHCGQNTRGMAGGQNWELWCNTLSSSACMTTFNATAFSARWNNNGDFLARVGLEFGNSGRPYEEYGTLKADFSFKKSGSGGGFSYIGIYGWTNNPCVEWYIVDDRYGTMPFDAYNATSRGMATIDGESYELFQNRTNGTGGSRCSGVSQWDQFWSIRQSARQCGTITISEHFRAWEAAGLAMGGLLEAKILVETGGSNGSIEFPVARVTAE